ncbi:MAG TPA: hypothetical protein VH475_01415 [Tepidisphaeraceae bacterium]|jgi:hypothetical protein
MTVEPTPSDLPLAPPQKGSPLIDLGGMLGVAAACIGLGIFLLGCFGFERAFALYWIPLAFAGLGLVLTVVGGVLRHGGVELTPILAAIFVNLFGLVGGLLECALWHGWDIFYRPPTP